MSLVFALDGGVLYGPEARGFIGGPCRETWLSTDLLMLEVKKEARNNDANSYALS